jgi:hypothetical protein
MGSPCCLPVCVSPLIFVRRFLKSPCSLCVYVPLIFGFLCDPCRIKGKQAISFSQKFMCIVWDHFSVFQYVSPPHFWGLWDDRAVCVSVSPLIFLFQCGPHLIKGKYAINSSLNFLCILWDHFAVCVLVCHPLTFLRLIRWPCFLCPPLPLLGNRRSVCLGPP